MRSIPLAALAASLVLGGSARAQDFAFTIDQAQSNWSWAGSTSVGPLEGNPSTSFQLAGGMLVDLAGGGSPVSSGRIHSANAQAVPDLHGLIPNPLTFLPPLALVDVTNLVVDDSTPSFAVAGNGSFSTEWTITILSGTLTVTPIAGGVTTTELAGLTGLPEVHPGSIVESGGTLVLQSTQSTTFDFTDPGSGISGTLTLAGTIRATFDCPAPASYCVTSPNSVGSGVVISSTGSTSIAANDLVLVATGAPPNQNGIFYFGPNQAQFPFGDGQRCVSGGVHRLGIVNAGPGGTFTKALDHGALPGTASIASGDTWNFQCWYRDPAAGMSGFNLSDALEVFFCP